MEAYAPTKSSVNTSSRLTKVSPQSGTQNGRVRGVYGTRAL